MTVGVYGGITVIPSEHVPDGTMYVLNEQALMVKHEDEVAYYGRLARWQVRDGLSDVVAWLGQQVGPKPVRHLPDGANVAVITTKVR